MTSRQIFAHAFAIGIALAALSPVTALAVFYDGNKFYERCGSDNASELCAGYVAAVADGFGRSARTSECINEGATLKQVFDIAIAYMRDNPAQRHASAANLIELALVQAFCPAG